MSRQAHDQFLEFAIHDRHDNFLGYVRNAKDYGFRSALNDFGAGVFKTPIQDYMDTPGIFERMNKVYVMHENNPIGMFVIESPHYRPRSSSGPDDEYVSVSGRNAMAALNRVIIYPESPTGGRERIWQNVHAANVMLTLLADAQSRGFIELRPSFTHTHDSLGAPWQDVSTFKYSVGQPLWIVARSHIGRGLYVWVTPDNLLHYAQNPGRDRSEDVIFREGRDLISFDVKLNSSRIINRLIVESEGKHFEYSNHASIERYGPYEGYIEANEADGNETAMQEIADVYLQRYASPEETITLKLTVTHYVPFVHYNLGDFITVDLRDSVFTGSYRVHAIAVSLRNDRLEVDVDLAQPTQPIERQLMDAIGSIVPGGATFAAHDNYGPIRTDKTRIQVVDSLGAVNNPVEGLIVTERGSGTLHIYDGNQWKPI